MPGAGEGVQRGPAAATEHRAAAHWGDVLTEALDALEAGDGAGAAEAFGAAWLEAYSMDAVDANAVTDVVGAFGIGHSS